MPRLTFYDYIYFGNKMKTPTWILLFIFLGLLSYSQGDTTKPKPGLKNAVPEKPSIINEAECTFLIDNVKFKQYVPKDMLLKLCSLKIATNNPEKFVQPVSFHWSVHDGYNRHKPVEGNNPADCAKLISGVKQTEQFDFIVIDQVKCREPLSTCSGKYYLKLEH